VHSEQRGKDIASDVARHQYAGQRPCCQAYRLCNAMTTVWTPFVIGTPTLRGTLAPRSSNREARQGGADLELQPTAHQGACEFSSRERAEQLGQPAAEVFGRIEKAAILLRPFDETVVCQPFDGDRGVVRPHGAVVIAHRGEGVHVGGQSSYLEARVQQRSHEMRCHCGGLVVVDDAGPQAMAHIRSDGVDLTLAQSSAVANACCSGIQKAGLNAALSRADSAGTTSSLPELVGKPSHDAESPLGGCAVPNTGAGSDARRTAHAITRRVYALGSPNACKSQGTSAWEQTVGPSCLSVV